MFKLSYKEIRSQSFMTTMQKIARCQDYRNMKVTMRVANLLKKVEDQLNKSQGEWVKLADTLIQKNEDKSYKQNAGGFVWLDGVDPEEAEKKVVEFMDKEVIVECKKLTPFDLEPVKLSPADVSNLVNLLDMPPDLDSVK